MSEHNPAEHPDARLERARREILAQAAKLSERPRLERRPPRVVRDERVDRARLDYRVGELTDAHHHAFVEQAFHALLKRSPTPAESEAQLALLAAGSTKAEALGNLRWSPEGRAIGARVAGLAPRYVMAKLRRVPLLGYLVDIPLNLAALPKLARHQRASDALLAAGDEAAQSAIRELAKRLADADARAAHAQRRIDELQAFANELDTARDAMARHLDDVEVHLRTRIEAEERTSAAHAGRFEEFEFIRQRFYAINHWTHHLGEAFARIESAAAQGDADRRGRALRLAEAEAAADAARAKRNAAWALALRAELGGEARVFVCACGADWPRELAAGGCRVVHADADAAPVRAETFDVEPVAAFEALRRCADASLDGVAALAASHLARSRALLDWLGEAQRALKPGAPLLLADAREPCAIADALLRPAPSSTAALATYSPALFASAGFAGARRVDAADGTPAWLMRRSVA